MGYAVGHVLRAHRGGHRPDILLTLARSTDKSSSSARVTMIRRLFALTLCLVIGSASAGEKADLVRVTKSESRLYLQKGGKTFASFHVAFGASPGGHKQKQGDERTPEGRYVLDAK